MPAEYARVTSLPSCLSAAISRSYELNVPHLVMVLPLAYLEEEGDEEDEGRRLKIG